MFAWLFVIACDTDRLNSVTVFKNKVISSMKLVWYLCNCCAVVVRIQTWFVVWSDSAPPKISILLTSECWNCISCWKRHDELCLLLPHCTASCTSLYACFPTVPCPNITSDIFDSYNITAIDIAVIQYCPYPSHAPWWYFLDHGCRHTDTQLILILYCVLMAFSTIMWPVWHQWALE